MRRPKPSPLRKAFRRRHPVFDYRPPLYFRLIKWTGFTAATLAVVSALYVGFWFWAAGRLRDSTLAWIDARRAAGLTLTYARLDIDGFPFRLRLAVVAPKLGAAGGPAPWGWQGDTVVLSMRPWSLSHFTVAAPGNHAFLWTEGGRPRTLALHADALAANVTASGGRPARTDLDAAGLTLTPGGGAPFAMAHAHARLDLPEVAEGATHRTPVAEANLTLRGLHPPAALRLPLGSEVQSFEVAATLLGPIGGSGLVPALAAWRDEGGTIEVRRLTLGYGPLSLSADGTLALDGSMQPVGAFTARIEGFFETIDALRERGIVRGRDAVTAKMVLGVLSQRGEDGRAVLNVPITIQDRTLFAGPVALTRIPEISWGGAVPAGPVPPTPAPAPPGGSHPPAIAPPTAPPGPARPG